MRRRGPQKAPTNKVPTTIRIDAGLEAGRL
ncbi:MAG: hypothetical protein GAK38_03852 [Xylophilus sp.]|nr:MAG: hypothetical protein GAK38_03852 [Xylophilus sp.]